ITIELLTPNVRDVVSRHCIKNRFTVFGPLHNGQYCTTRLHLKCLDRLATFERNHSHAVRRRHAIRRVSVRISDVFAIWRNDAHRDSAIHDLRWRPTVNRDFPKRWVCAAWGSVDYPTAVGRDTGKRIRKTRRQLHRIATVDMHPPES